MTATRKLAHDKDLKKHSQKGLFIKPNCITIKTL